MEKAIRLMKSIEDGVRATASWHTNIHEGCGMEVGCARRWNADSPVYAWPTCLLGRRRQRTARPRLKNMTAGPQSPTCSAIESWGSVAGTSSTTSAVDTAPALSYLCPSSCTARQAAPLFPFPPPLPPVIRSNPQHPDYSIQERGNTAQQ